VPSKDIMACNVFGFLRGGWGALTERVVAHPTTLSPFPQVFFITATVGSAISRWNLFMLTRCRSYSLKRSYVFNEVTLCVLSLKYFQTGILCSCNAYCL